MTSKICIKCALTKHLDEYRKGRNSCKACEAATLKEWRSANKEKMEASRKVWSYVNKDSVTDHVREKKIVNESAIFSMVEYANFVVWITPNF
jgi:hypothetical protein